MTDKKEAARISKFLSLVLRHQPELIGIELDEQGWTSIPVLLEKLQHHRKILSREKLDLIVQSNEKQRFAFDGTGERIRASQGHSVNVHLGYTPQQPPALLFHGTGEGSVAAIETQGLQKRNRHHVHLSADRDTAVKVGQRHGKPFVFRVLAEHMYRDGFVFYKSENGVWLTDQVPVRYLERDKQG